MQAAASYAASTAAKDLTQRAVAGTQARTNAILWDSYNWPTSCGPFNVLHLDLDELHEKRGERVAYIVTVVYRWWQIVFFTTLLNLVSCIVLAATVPDSYSNVNPIYSCFNIVIATVGGTYAWYGIYRGLADAETSGLFWSKIVMIVLLILSLVQALGDFGNVNGLANLGASRLSDARDESSGGGQFWTAMSIVESLAWLGSIGVGGYASYLLWTN